MKRCLIDQIGRNIHTYINDIAVMSEKKEDLNTDLVYIFSDSVLVGTH
jgi:hypothetical protein